MAKVGLLVDVDQRGKDFFHLVGILQVGGVHTEPSANTDAVGVCHDAALSVNIAQQKIGNFPSPPEK